MPVTIERATIFDITPLLRLLDKWFDETLLEGLPRDCTYSAVWLADLIHRQLVLVARLDEKIIGAIGLMFTHLPWNNLVSIITNPFIMTEKEYRHLGVANKLIGEAKEFAKKNKLILQICHMSAKDAKLKDRYLESIQGFKYAGGTLYYTGE